MRPGGIKGSNRRRHVRREDFDQKQKKKNIYVATFGGFPHRWAQAADKVQRDVYGPMNQRRAGLYGSSKAG